LKIILGEALGYGPALSEHMILEVNKLASRSLACCSR
jgi:hypothetical protein